MNAAAPSCIPFLASSRRVVRVLIGLPNCHPTSVMGSWHPAAGAGNAILKETARSITFGLAVLDWREFRSVIHQPGTAGPDDLYDPQADSQSRRGSSPPSEARIGWIGNPAGRAHEAPVGNEWVGDRSRRVRRRPMEAGLATERAPIRLCTSPHRSPWSGPGRASRPGVQTLGPVRSGGVCSSDSRTEPAR